MMLLEGELAGETQPGKGPGKAPGPASHGLLGGHTGQWGRLTRQGQHCRMSLWKRRPVRQEKRVTRKRVVESGAVRVSMCRTELGTVKDGLKDWGAG